MTLKGYITLSISIAAFTISILKLAADHLTKKREFMKYNFP